MECTADINQKQQRLIKSLPQMHECDKMSRKLSRIGRGHAV